MAATTNDPKQFLRIKEQAQWLGVHPRTIVRIAASDPSFPAEIPITGKTRVRRLPELEAWLQAKQAPAAPAPPPSGGDVVPLKRGRGRPRRTPE